MYLQLQGKQKHFPHSYFCHFWNLNYFSNKIYIKKSSFSCKYFGSKYGVYNSNANLYEKWSFISVLQTFSNTKSYTTNAKVSTRFFQNFFCIFCFLFHFFIFHLSIFFMYLWLCQPLLLSLCALHLFDEIFHLFSPIFLHLYFWKRQKDDFNFK